MPQFDYVVVGSGFFGAVLAERIANDLGKTVVVVEKRSHIGGNCYSSLCPDTGIEFHKYGTHIFHTGSEEVWNYIKNFTEFNSYHHQVLTNYKGRIYPLPINLETINLFYQMNLKPFEVDRFLEQEREKEFYTEPTNLEEKAINLIGRPLYEAFIKGYTEKQWGKRATELPLSIIQRLPVRKNYDRTYFKDTKFQGIPLNGFSAVFEKLLSSSKIKVITDCDFLKHRVDFIPKEKIIYTGPIDGYFGYKLGKLEWRSIRLEKEIVNAPDFQGTSVMNYAEKMVPYTRVHEPRHLHPERTYGNKSVVFYEYPEMRESEPFYPVATQTNIELYKNYREVCGLDKKLIVGGRLGNYCYVDMDQVIQMALNCYKKQVLQPERSIVNEKESPL